MFDCDTLVYVGGDETMDGPVRDDNNKIIERMETCKPARRRKGRAKQLVRSSSTAAVASDATGNRKNAVMLLNELQPGGLRYDDVTKSGPDHKPVYTASVAIYGQVGRRRLSRLL